jgi:hypothetical protein
MMMIQPLGGGLDMIMDSGRAWMAWTFASLAAGPGLLLGFTFEALVQRDFGQGGWSDLVDPTFWWLIALAIFLGAIVSAIPNAILVAGLGLLGRSQGWARNILVWILLGLALGLLVAWRMSETTLSISPSVAIAGGLCGLIARLCMRWTPDAVEVEEAAPATEPQAPA